MLKTKIKASGVTNLTDARYFAARGVEWIGFRVDKTDGLSITPLAARAIAEWIDGVKIVGEFEFAVAKDIKEVNDLLHFDAVQVGMFTSVAELEKLQELAIIKEVVVQNNTTEAEITQHFQQYAPYCSYFLLDFLKTGINWGMLQASNSLSVAFLQTLCAENEVILAIDFTVHQMRQLLETLQPKGLSISGGKEDRVGLKSFEELDDMLDSLEIISYS